ncbi:MAG: hypothetical protein KA314_04505 [Chloroflexi bacterium]|nr:hypothetical protein [Chloroflexota bacterium]
MPTASEGQTDDQLPVTSTPLPVDAPCPSGTISIFGEVLTAILKANEVAIGRVWLVARSVDRSGCGHITVASLQKALPKLSLRRVRQLLRDGNGRYWCLAGSSIYLQGQARVAARLGIRRIRQNAVTVLVARLAQGVKAAKAIMWNATQGSHKGTPISRKKLAGLGVRDPRTQRGLERLEGVRAAQQYAIVGPENEYDRRQAQENGEPIFVLRDYKGVWGERGRVYLARHLPNSYTGTLETVRHGKKWFNRRLCKLHEQGPGATTRPQIERVFFADGKQAGRAWDKQPLADTYWPVKRARACRAWWTIRGVSSLELASIELQKQMGK